jgi:hypothetical protein
MQFALVNNERTLPAPGLIGACPACGSPMIAKCGNVRRHHWAHRSVIVCHGLREPETEWHRTWKNEYPADWRERIFQDPLGEKHIADVFTEHGLTIEFQHSALKHEERAAREAFHKNMVWVVNGMRLKNDLPRFLQGFKSFRQFNQEGLYIAHFPDEAFPRAWLNRCVPVLFDFGGARGLSQVAIFASQSLWCLLPVRVLGRALVQRVRREDFVRWTHDMAHPIPTRSIVEQAVVSLLTEQRRERQLAEARAFQHRRQAWSGRRGYPRF